MTQSLAILIVDDEAPARERLRDILGDIQEQMPTRIVGVAANGIEALRFIEQHRIDVALVDIRMPGMDGIEFAQHLSRLEQAPRIVFVTAYDEYAVQAFELNAIDYLLKPARAERLLAALEKLQHQPPVTREVLDSFAEPRAHFTSSERGKIYLIPVSDVLYLKAELKYVTARTVEREYVLEESLVNLEQEFAQRFVRIHRNCLVAQQAIAGFERQPGSDIGEGHWAVRLHDIPETLPISRRQWGSIKHLVGR